jgi:hypothetical protein
MVRTRTTNRNAAREQGQAQPTAAETTTENTTASGTGAGATAAATRPATAPASSTASTRPAAQTSAAANLPSVQTGQRSLATPEGRNAFESYGQQMSMTSITGTLIKFNKGDWVTGDDEDLEEGTELVANMDALMVGWIKWIDQRPAEQIMGPVAEAYQPPRRSELGDTDQSQWEQDQDGRPRDPWQLSNYIVMKEPGQDASEANLYTFATSSKGGLGALGALCKVYGKEMRTRPDDYPIVKLGSDHYNHATFGRTYVPVFDVIGWEPKAQFAEVAEVRTVAREEEPEPPAQEAARPARAAGRRR